MLRKEPVGREIGEDDAFVFNDAYSSKFYKVKISTIAAAKESEPEKAETRHKVEEDRKPQARARVHFCLGNFLDMAPCLREHTCCPNIWRRFCKRCRVLLLASIASRYKFCCPDQPIKLQRRMLCI